MASGPVLSIGLAQNREEDQDKVAWGLVALALWEGVVAQTREGVSPSVVADHIPLAEEVQLELCTQ